LLSYTVDWQNRLRTARRIFSLVPVLVFLSTLILFAGPVGESPYLFMQLLLRVIAASLASSFVCIAAYGFYRYLLERSPGL
jgi:hypothetical protein